MMESSDRKTITEFSISPMKRNSSVSEVVKHIVQTIVKAEIKPGEKLPPERRLTEMLGVSRSVLRESLKCLELLGFVEILQGDGTYLASNSTNLLLQVVSWGFLLDTAQARELIEARRHIEMSLVRLATERSTQEERAEIRACIDEMEEAADSDAFSAADSRFHLAIARSARNSVLSSVLENAKTLLQVWVVRVLGYSADKDSIIRQHSLIADAIEAGDADAAVKAMNAHLSSVTRLLQSSLE